MIPLQGVAAEQVGNPEAPGPPIFKQPDRPAQAGVVVEFPRMIDWTPEECVAEGARLAVEASQALSGRIAEHIGQFLEDRS